MRETIRSGIELEVVHGELKIALANLDSWAQPYSVPTPVVALPGSSFIIPVSECDIYIPYLLLIRNDRSRTAFFSSSRHGTTPSRLCLHPSLPPSPQETR